MRARIRSRRPRSLREPQSKESTSGNGQKADGWPYQASSGGSSGRGVVCRASCRAALSPEVAGELRRAASQTIRLSPNLGTPRGADRSLRRIGNQPAGHGIGTVASNAEGLSRLAVRRVQCADRGPFFHPRARSRSRPSGAAQGVHAEHLGVLLKVETRAAFENLPRILLAALQSRPVGVMVARGDLAVEMGFERMAEVQEEILWRCEAAHIPVIWATQVLENLTPKGVPSRAEVSDAAMSARAECVMLNKGPHILEAVRFLAGIHQRMRKLSISELRPARRQGQPQSALAG